MFRIVEVITGIMIIFIGLSLIAMDQLSGVGSGVEYGGIVVIGPFPILFGNSTSAIAISSIFLVIFVIFTLLAISRWRW